MLQKSFPRIPGHIRRLLRYVITLCSTDRNDHNILKTQSLRKLIDILHDLVKTALTVTNKIHLINSKYKMMDTHQSADTRMTSCLHQNTLFCVHKNNGKLGKRSANCHVSCILLMTRSICNNKTSLIRCKITVCNINGDTLLTLSHQTIQKKRIINGTTSGTYLAVQKKGFFLVRI